MNRRLFRLMGSACLLCAMPLHLAHAQSPPDLTRMAEADYANLPDTASLCWNLGPTGLRGWVFGSKGDSKLARQILITSVEPGSPADGLVQRHDVVLGIGDKRFDADARRLFGEAIAAAEANRGVLKLMRWRHGKTDTVTLRLKPMRAYHPTRPTAEGKGRVVLERACELVADAMPPEGYKGVFGAVNGLLLLSSGDPKYLDHCRRTAHLMASIEPDSNISGGLKCWGWGFHGLYLGEYYLATGDRSVLDGLKKYADAIARGQIRSGSWGHNPSVDGIGRGYGEVNQVGLPCLLTLILARESGLEIDEAALGRSVNFFRRYVGTGSIPYGDHPPWRKSHSAAGKNAATAVVFDLLDMDRERDYFVALVAASAHERELGHTGNYFSYLWGPAGAQLAGDDAYRAFINEQLWYYDLCRRWDGGLMVQPWPHKREGPNGMNIYAKRGPAACSGAMAMAYAVTHKRLRIHGGASSPFDTRDKARSLATTLADIERRMQAGDVYTARFQLEALQNAGYKDGRLAALTDRIEAQATDRVIAAGKRYHGAIATAADTSRGLRFAPKARFNSRARNTLTQLSRDASAGPYRQLAAEALEALNEE